MKSVKSKEQDALVMVRLRNTFYKKKFYFALAVYFLSLIVIGFLISVLIFLIKNPTQPIYFVTDDVSRLIHDVPKNMPNMSTSEVENWAKEAVESAYSYDFVNYRAQLQSAQKYFTDYGWRNYMDGLDSSSNLIGLTQRKYVIIAKVVAKPKLVVEGLLGGAYAWKFRMPLLVTILSPPYTDNPKFKFQNPLMITVVVQRQSILSSYKGLGVVQMIGDLASTPTEQNLSVIPEKK